MSYSVLKQERQRIGLHSRPRPQLLEESVSHTQTKLVYVEQGNVEY